MLLTPMQCTGQGPPNTDNPAQNANGAPGGGVESKSQCRMSKGLERVQTSSAWRQAQRVLGDKGQFSHSVENRTDKSGSGQTQCGQL